MLIWGTVSCKIQYAIIWCIALLIFYWEMWSKFRSKTIVGSAKLVLQRLIFILKRGSIYISKDPCLLFTVLTVGRYMTTNISEA